MSRNIFFWLYCVEKTNDGKWPFFDKNHWLTPLENFDFFYFFHVHKTFFCIQNITKQTFLSYFAEKKTVLPSPLPRRSVVGTRFGFLHHWKALELPEQMFEGSLSLRKNESKGRQHGWQAQYGLGWIYPLFVPMGRGVGLLIKDIYVVGCWAFHTLWYTNFKHFPTHLYTSTSTCKIPAISDTQV